MKRYLPLTAIMAAAAALAACNNATPSMTPAPGPTCSPPAGTQSALAYPAPGATGVSDTFGQVIIGSSPALPASWNVVLVTAISTNGVGGTTLQPAPTPLPSPNATPSFPNPQYQTSSFAGTSFPGEVVNAYLNDTSTNCTPLGPIGSFTTQ